MCGVAGLFAKNSQARARLGADLAAMVEHLAERGPDSAGFAIYGEPPEDDFTRLSVLASAEGGWEGVVEELGAEFGAARLIADRGDQATVAVDADPASALAWVALARPDLVALGAGATLEVVKRVGPPAGLVDAAGLRALSGSHAIAHTRMATESRVSTAHSHPFCPAPELALVHNGSLSNHNGLRRELARRGVAFETDNDSEVAARFLAWRLAEGDDLEGALELAAERLDGFFTFLVADADGIAVLRDRFACKPALIAETDDWVAVASERAAISALPGGADAVAWEPEPARIYRFSRAGAAA